MSEFERLFANAVAACDSGASTSDFEAEFARVLKFAKQHPELRKQIEAVFVNALADTPTPWELIGFCMHALRWASVRATAESMRTRASDPRSERVYRLVLEAFDDNWDQREMYSYDFDAC